MKKFALTLVCAAFVTSMFVGCGKKETAVTTENVTAEAVATEATAGTEDMTALEKEELAGKEQFEDAAA